MAKTINLPKNKNVAKPSPTKTGKGHFAAAAQRIAKLRSGTLQHGVPRHAPLGGPQVGKSGIARQLDSGLLAQSSEGQSALNPKQQGATNKKAQRNGATHDGFADLEGRH